MVVPYSGRRVSKAKLTIVVNLLRSKKMRARVTSVMAQRMMIICVVNNYDDVCAGCTRIRVVNLPDSLTNLAPDAFDPGVELRPHTHPLLSGSSTVSDSSAFDPVVERMPPASPLLSFSPISFDPSAFGPSAFDLNIPTHPFWESEDEDDNED